MFFSFSPCDNTQTDKRAGKATVRLIGTVSPVFGIYVFACLAK